MGVQLSTPSRMASRPNYIRNLSVAEKYEPIDALWGDRVTHPQALSAELAEEIDRRIAAYEKDPGLP